jgi:hypothetical protein
VSKMLLNHSKALPSDYCRSTIGVGGARAHMELALLFKNIEIMVPQNQENHVKDRNIAK